MKCNASVDMLYVSASKVHPFVLLPKMDSKLYFGISICHIMSHILLEIISMKMALVYITEYGILYKSGIY